METGTGKTYTYVKTMYELSLVYYGTALWYTMITKRYLFDMEVEKMSYEPGIQSNKELEFAVFCIENIAQRLQVNAEQVYAALTEKSDILNSYIVPEYDILHTQSRDYIVDDILQVMRERGVAV